MTNRIKAAREAKGITRKQLAEMTGLHYNKIGNYETGYFKIENIPVGNLYLIAKALECKIDDLIID